MWGASWAVLFAGIVAGLVGVTAGAVVLTLGIVLICTSIGMNVYLALEIAQAA